MYACEKTTAQEKALGFLSPSAYDKMMTNTLGQRETGEKQII